MKQDMEQSIILEYKMHDVAMPPVLTIENDGQTKRRLRRKNRAKDNSRWHIVKDNLLTRK